MSLKAEARTTHEKPSILVARSISNLPKSVAGIHPRPELLRRKVIHERKRNSSVPSSHVDLTQLTIPAAYTQTYANEEFLQFDSGPGRNRVLLFSTKRNLSFLRTVDHWYMDGTFKTCPSLFTQLYTIHGAKDGTSLPLVYGLLPDKQEQTYNRFFDAFQNLGVTAGITFQPKSIMTDFEMSSVKALKRVFPAAESRGCFFHLSQCIWRRIQQNRDILEKYNDMTDPDFALLCTITVEL